MQKISSLGLSLLVTTTVLATVPAYAAEKFYLEIGNHATPDEVSSEWKTVSEKHRKLLGKLEFFPKNVVENNGKALQVIQAGPVADKQRAQAICNKLFAGGVSCFVIEGIEDRPPSSVGYIGKIFGGVSTSNAAKTQDDAKSTNYVTIPAPAQSNEPQVLGHVSAAATSNLAAAKPPVVDDKKTEVAEKASAEKYTEKKNEPNDSPVLPKPEVKNESKMPEANIDVAQAIPVPVSNIKTPDKKPAVANPQLYGDVISAKELPPAQFASADAGWLNVAAFVNEDEANLAISKIRDKSPDAVAGMRVRIIKSMIATYEGGKYQISFGPFSGSDNANSFCRAYIMPIGSELKCSFVPDESAKVDDVVEKPARYMNSETYSERRRSLPDNSSATASQGRYSSRSDLVENKSNYEKPFFARIVAADSKKEASKRLEDIKSKNADILSGIASKISKSSAEHAKYSAMIGPLPDETSAYELCETLQDRGVDCLVIGGK